MSMYTQLHLGIILNKDISNETKELLNYMLGNTDFHPALPDHSLFQCDRWSSMLRCDSYYFDYKTTHHFEYDKIGDHYWFNVTTNLKNYNDKIMKFLDWIHNFMEKSYSDDMCGYSHYEEDEDPFII